jgi:hypothetical protein
VSGHWIGRRGESRGWIAKGAYANTGLGFIFYFGISHLIALYFVIAAMAKALTFVTALRVPVFATQVQQN